MKKKNPVIHFELPSNDSLRMQHFYAEVFGSEAKDLGSEMGNYILAITTELDENDMPLHPGTINGGFFPVLEGMPVQCPVIVIRVDEIETAVADIKKAGGSLQVDPMDIPGIGKYAAFIDTEGNHLAMLQPTPEKELQMDHMQALESKKW